MKFAVFIGLCVTAVTVNAQEDRENDIVVEGRRSVLQGGNWSVNLSRSYTSGRAYNSDDLRSTGMDKTWHICLSSTDVEPLIRTLVGEGQTSSTVAHCSRLQIRLGSGRIRATQSCFGTTMMPQSRDAGKISVGNGTNGRTGIGPDIASDRNVAASPPEPPIRARNTLNVTGLYSNSNFTLDFADIQEPEIMMPSSNGLIVRNERHWSIKGQRQGECAKLVPK